MPYSAPSDKAIAILDATRVLMMDRGFNGFSFRDVAAEVGIKSASIHYHYATKADLAVATAKSYREAFLAALEGIKGDDALTQLNAYGGLFVATLKDQGGLCLGGMLAADATTLPEPVRIEVNRFFNAQHEWLAYTVLEGQKRNEIRDDLDPDAFAKMFLSGLEGAMMVSRGMNQPQDLEATLALLIQLARPYSAK